MTCAVITVLSGAALARQDETATLIYESFETPDAVSLWKTHVVTAQLSREHVTDGEYSLRVAYPKWVDNAEKWPAVFRNDAAGIIPADTIQRYSVLKFDVFVERTPELAGVSEIPLRLRIDDIHGAQYTTGASVPVGTPYTFSVPFDKSASFVKNGVRHINLFMSQPQHGAILYFDNIRLESAPLEIIDFNIARDPFILGHVLISGTFSSTARYRIEIRDSQRKLIRIARGSQRWVQWEWDGHDSDGAQVPDGDYTLSIVARGPFGEPGWDVRRELGVVPVRSEKAPAYLWWPLHSTEEVTLTSRPDERQLTRRNVELKLARNEYEAAQVAVRPRPGFDLKDMHVTVENLRNTASGEAFPEQAITIYQVGHVQTHLPPPPYDHDFIGWHPDPLIPADTFDVASGDTQGIWIQLKTPVTIQPGLYEGTIAITPSNAPATRIPFAVTVWDFALPEVSHCRTLFDVRGSAGPYPDKDPAEVLKTTQEFVFQHRINPWRIYNTTPPPVELLDEYIPRGMNAVNLIYIQNQQFTPEAAAAVKTKIDPTVQYMREKGWIDRAVVYGFDETRSWGDLKAWADWFQANYPDVPFGTTSYDETYGVRTDIENIDFWTPLTPQYNRGAADARRADGKEIWWYTCIVPHHPYANWFIEYPLIEARLLWWMTYQSAADGYLYYAIDRWPVNNKPLEGAPRTDWDPASFNSANGDGCLMYGGPDGPMTGMRFEAVRDGLEEYEYFWLLEQATGSREAGEEIAGRLIKSLTNYSRDSEDFYRVREELARAIIRAR